MASKKEIKDIEYRIDTFCDNLQKELDEKMKEFIEEQPKKTRTSTKKASKK